MTSWLEIGMKELVERWLGALAATYMEVRRVGLAFPRRLLDEFMEASRSSTSFHSTSAIIRLTHKILIPLAR